MSFIRFFCAAFGGFGPSRASVLLLAFVASLLVSACSSGLRLTHLRTAAEKPNKVSVLFKVDDKNDTPVPGLGPSNFQIYEDGNLVPQHETRQVVSSPPANASFYTLVLVDMTAYQGAGAAENMAEAASAFVESADRNQRVAVYAFDGGSSLYPVVGFSGDPDDFKNAMRSVGGTKPKDANANLHGAVVSALKELDRTVGRREQSMRFGSLVVLTEGNDRKGRVSGSQMRKAVDESANDVYCVGYGTDIGDSVVKSIGKTHHAVATNRASLTQAFKDVGVRLDVTSRRIYQLRYCSSVRSGEHRLRIEALTVEPQTKNERSGKLDTRFSAQGFFGTCDLGASSQRSDANRPDPTSAKEQRPDMKGPKGSDQTSPTNTTSPSKPETVPDKPKEPLPSPADFNP